jgi:hypothetical protein
MKKITVNFTQSDVEDLQHSMPDEGNERVFNWTFTAEDGTEVDVEVTVGNDEC